MADTLAFRIFHRANVNVYKILFAPKRSRDLAFWSDRHYALGGHRKAVGGELPIARLPAVVCASASLLILAAGCLWQISFVFRITASVSLRFVAGMGFSLILVVLGYLLCAWRRPALPTFAIRRRCKVDEWPVW